MNQINGNTSIKTEVNNINPYPIKYKGPHKLHTKSNTILVMSSTTEEWDNCEFSMMGKYKPVNSEDHYSSIKRQKENSFFGIITKMDHNLNNSTTKMIHTYQILIRLKFLFIDPKWTQSDLMNHTTTSILWTIPMMTLTLLRHMNNTINNILSNNNSFKIQINI